jgi:hypothetical protein
MMNNVQHTIFAVLHYLRANDDEWYHEYNLSRQKEETLTLHLPTHPQL